MRIAEARALLDAGHADGAYYLAGYAVECALKACIAKRTNQHDFPDKFFAQKAWTHNLEDLIKLVEPNYESEIGANSVLQVNWTLVKDWNERSRYERKTPDDARALFDAITDATNGVLPWIRNRW